MRPRHRPPWWPDGEAWPPPDGEWSGQPWRRGRAWGPGSGRSGMRRGFGCFIVLLATLVVSVGVLALWLLAQLFGVVVEGPLAELARAAGLVVLVVGLVALVVGIRIATGVGRPLSELVEAAGRIEAADYSVRVPEAHRRGDLRGLGRAFNQMAARLEAEDATRRRLLADVSHELRTPLAVIQGNLEALVDGVYPADDEHLRTILDETRVLERLVDDLRTLSLAESGALPLHREAVDVRVLLEDAATAHRANAAASSIALHVEVAEGLPTPDLDPMRMRQVLTNLVENAIRAMAGGGTIRLAARPSGDGIEIEVVDDGPGIPPDLLPTVFERFSKSGASRGSGLGLAIARAIVTAHGGTIAAEAGDAGRGTRIRIAIPMRG